MDRDRPTRLKPYAVVALAGALAAPLPVAAQTWVYREVYEGRYGGRAYAPDYYYAVPVPPHAVPYGSGPRIYRRAPPRQLSLNAVTRIARSGGLAQVSSVLPAGDAFVVDGVTASRRPLRVVVDAYDGTIIERQTLTVPQRAAQPPAPRAERRREAARDPAAEPRRTAPSMPRPVPAAPAPAPVVPEARPSPSPAPPVAARPAPERAPSVIPSPPAVPDVPPVVIPAPSAAPPVAPARPEAALPSPAAAPAPATPAAPAAAAPPPEDIPEDGPPEASVPTPPRANLTPPPQPEAVPPRREEPARPAAAAQTVAPTAPRQPVVEVPVVQVPVVQVPVAPPAPLDDAARPAKPTPAVPPAGLD